MTLRRPTQLVRPPARWAAIFAAIFATSACSSDQDSGDSGAKDGGPKIPAPTLEDAECHPAEVGEIPPEVGYSCHRLTVPEHRGDRYDGDTLRLSVTVLKSTADNPAPDPVVYLSGGPGGRGGWPSFWATTPFIERGDVIVYEQRGTGASDPDMECPEMEAAIVAVFEADADPATEEAAVSAAVAACADRLSGSEADVTAFSTPHSADDLEDLRVALGVEQWNVLGISYGSRLAQDYMRRHPDGIRSVILDSTYPLKDDGIAGNIEDADRAIEQLVAGCAAAPNCAAAHPDLGAEIDALITQWNADPYRVNVDLGGDFGPTDVVITGNDVAAGIFDAMYDSDLIVLLPSFVKALTNGSTLVADELAVQGINFSIGRAEGMALATECTDQAPLVDIKTDGELPPDVGRWGTYAGLIMSQHCDAWPAGAGDPTFSEPVASDLPTLVLSGTADPITPTPRAQTVADHLSNGTFVTFESFGHGVWDTSDCSESIVMDFLSDPTAALDVSCATALGPRDFFP